MAVQAGATPDRPGLEALFDTSPAVEARTSAWAVTAFMAGVGSLLAAPFSLTFSLAALLVVVAFCSALAAVVATSRPGVGGTALAPLGMLLGLVTAVFLGVRFAHLDTAFGDHYLPVLVHLLERFNTDLRAP